MTLPYPLQSTVSGFWQTKSIYPPSYISYSFLIGTKLSKIVTENGVVAWECRFRFIEMSFDEILHKRSEGQKEVHAREEPIRGHLKILTEIASHVEQMQCISLHASSEL